MNVTISDLRQQPAFFDAVADRIWRAWWKERGFPAEYITERLRENMSPSPIPFALVAHRDAAFVGTASVISADLEERPPILPLGGCGLGRSAIPDAGDRLGTGQPRGQRCFRAQYPAALPVRRKGEAALLYPAGLAADRGERGGPESDGFREAGLVWWFASPPHSPARSFADLRTETTLE